jgi:O-antigen/teichoic acid export membrane protein
MIKAILKNKPLHNLLIYGVGQGFNLVTPILVVPYLIAVCGVEGYGKTGVGMAISFLLIVIIDYASDVVGVKDVAVNRDNAPEVSKILSTAYASRLLLLAAVVAVMSLLYIFIPYFNKEKELFFLSLPILLGQCINPSWVFQGLEKFKWITATTILSKLLYVAGVFIWVKTPNDYIYVNLSWGIGMIVPNAFATAYLCVMYNVQAKNTSIQDVLIFLRAHFSMFSSQLFMSLQLYAPMILISFFGGDAMAGKYKVIDQVIVIFKTYIFLFFNYVYPRVCYLLEKNVKEAMHFWTIFNAANFIFIAASMATLFLTAEKVVLYFANDDITEITALLQLALLIPLCLAVSIPLKQLVLGQNKQQFYVRLTTGTVVLNIALLLVLLPFYEIYGVIASLIITEVITALFYLAAIKTKPAVLN